jgi:hypothetical protein
MSVTDGLLGWFEVHDADRIRAAFGGGPAPLRQSTENVRSNLAYLHERRFGTVPRGRNVPNKYLQH